MSVSETQDTAGCCYSTSEVILYCSPHLGDNPVSRNYINVEVKESPNRPGVAQRVPGGLGSQIS